MKSLFSFIAGLFLAFGYALALNAQDDQFYEIQYTYTGENHDDYFGQHVAGGKDIDNDGYEDFAISAPFFDERRGKIYLYSGKTGNLIRTHSGANRETGFSRVTLGRIDNDNYADIIIGSGDKIQIFSGKSGELLKTFDEINGARFIPDCSDINNDGYDDICYQDSRTTPEKIIVRSGRTGEILHNIPRPASLDPRMRFGFSFGGALAINGDINNDSYNDIAIGAPTYRSAIDDPPGKVFVYSGKDSKLLYEFTGEFNNDAFGYHINFINDLDGDGYDELYVINWWNGVSARGYIISGTNSKILTRFTPYERIASAGDTTNDGLNDFIGQGDRFDQDSDLYLESRNNPAKRILAPRFFSFASSLAVSDIDSNGYKDVIAGNEIELVGNLRLGKVVVLKSLQKPITLSTQLHYYDSESNQWKQLSAPYSQFDPSAPTAVIVHGWNCNCVNTLNDQTDTEKPWTLQMAKAIHDKLPSKVNIFAWDWLYLARSPDLRDANTCSECGVWGTTTHHVPGEQVLNQAQLLSSTLNRLFFLKRYDKGKSIHCIGHSLGAHLVAWTGVRMLQSGSGYLPRQITCMDPPEADYFDIVKLNLQNICVPLSYLRDNSDQVFTEFYHGNSSALAHNTELWVNVPGWVHEVYGWYTGTIASEQNIALYQYMTYPAGRLSGTVGFGNSVLLPNNGSRPATCVAGKNETIAFSAIKWPPFANGFNSWPFCRTYACTCNSVSCQRDINPESVDLTKCVCTGDGNCQKETNRVVIRIPGKGKVVVTIRIHIKINWFFFNFNCDFSKAMENTEVTCVIRDGGKDDTIWTGSTDAYRDQGPINSGLINVHDHQNRDVEIVYEVNNGNNNGGEIIISNPVFSQDPSFGTPAPEVPPQLPDIPNVVLTAPGSSKGTVTLQCPPCKNPGEDITEYIWIVDGDYYSGEVTIDIELDIGIHVISLCLVDKFSQQTCAEKSVRVKGEYEFIRGDADGNGKIEITDAIVILYYLFLKADKLICSDAGDADDDGRVDNDISDPIYILSFLFLGGPAPKPPYPRRGSDPTPDTLGCDIPPP